MRKNNQYSNGRKKGSRLTLVLGIVAGVLVIALAAMLFLLPGDQDDAPETVPPTTEAPTEAPVVTEAPETVPAETEPVMLEHMAELYAQNADTVGWITIADTKIDYPVMYTPDEEDKYIHLSFEEKYSFGGLPYISENCSMDPESDNLIIYGHNMNNGTMFNNITNYSREKYWEEHPTISLTTLYEERTYEVLAAFYDRLYYNYEEGFKFYEFIDAEDEEHYNEAISYYKEHAEYDTGVTAEYGDRLITLVTCSYHVKYGRFVVVAREVTEDEVPVVTEAIE